MPRLDDNYHQTITKSMGQHRLFNVVLTNKNHR